VLWSFVSVVLSAGNGDVREAVVDQQLPFLVPTLSALDPRGLPLAAIAGHGVTIVRVRVLETDSKSVGLHLNGLHHRGQTGVYQFPYLWYSTVSIPHPIDSDFENGRKDELL
jgi:hypothetical protein